MSAPMVWECNNCGLQEHYVMVSSEDDVREIGCSRCGGNEWHKAKEVAAEGEVMQRSPALNVLTGQLLNMRG